MINLPECPGLTLEKASSKMFTIALSYLPAQPLEQSSELSPAAEYSLAAGIAGEGFRD